MYLVVLKYNECYSPYSNSYHRYVYCISFTIVWLALWYDIDAAGECLSAGDDQTSEDDE